VRESMGLSKPNGAMKREGPSRAALRSRTAQGFGRSNGPSQALTCRRGGARAHTLAPERW
jgi:hypothetical protein